MSTPKTHQQRTFNLNNPYISSTGAIQSHGSWQNKTLEIGWDNNRCMPLVSGLAGNSLGKSESTSAVCTRRCGESRSKEEATKPKSQNRTRYMWSGVRGTISSKPRRKGESGLDGDIMATWEWAQCIPDDPGPFSP